MAEIEKTAEVKEVAPIVPMVVTIASAQDVVKAVNILDSLVKKDVETRGKQGVTETGKALLAMHEVKALPDTLIDEAFKQGNITFSHQPQIRADYASVFNTLYSYVLSKNVPELSGLVATSSKKSKGDSTPSDKTFEALINAGGSVERILEAAMSEAKGVKIPRHLWKWNYNSMTKKVVMSVQKPGGLWEQVGTGAGYNAPGGLTYRAKIQLGYLEE